jgi:two-component system sensor histidine kinase/response regulator
MEPPGLARGFRFRLPPLLRPTRRWQTSGMFASGLKSKPIQSILLIDDDEVSREVTATLLTMTGLAVDASASGEAAVAALDGGAKPELILMDAQMPGLHGLELMAMLRQRTLAPIAMISGSYPAKELIEAADALLLKPFSLDDLKKTMQELQAKRPQIRACGKDQNAPAPVLRRETLAQFRAVMPEAGVRQLYRAIVDDLRRRAILLETALAANNQPEIRRIGHAIKGGCAMAGAVQAAQLGARIEEYPSGYQVDNGRNPLSDLHDAAEQLERILEVEFPA